MRHLRGVLMFGLVLLCWFGIFEVSLRTWGSSEAAPAFQGLFTGDPVIGYTLQPGARTRFTTSEFDTQIAINNAGVRDDQDLGPKPKGEKRIVVLGDSLVLSVQVDFAKTFTEGLEGILNAQRSPNDASTYRVINAGVQGYGPVEAMLFFRRAIAQLQPDVVLVSVFVGNDAEEAITSQVKLTSRGATERLRESMVTSMRRLVRRSMVLQILRRRVLTAVGGLQGTTGRPEPLHQTYAANPAPRIAQGIALTRQAIESIAADAASAGARAGIVLMPARFQVDDGDYGRLREIVAEMGGELVRDAATERFAAGLRELRLPMVDLLPPLRAAKAGSDLFFQENVHLTPRGHALVAETLADFMREHALLMR